MSIGLPDEASPLTAPPSPGSAAILVVDEDPAFQLGLKTFLREYVGFEKVFAARSGPEALELIEREPSIDIVTLDYQMPGMNGIEVLERLRESSPRTLSVIMITGYPSEELEDEFRSFSSPSLLATRFLAKPVEFEKLEPIVLKAHEELLAARRATKPKTPVIQLDQPKAPEPSPGESTHLVALSDEVALQRAQLEEIQREVRHLRRRWRCDFCLVALLVAACWAGVHFGWFEKLEPQWEKLKGSVSEVFSGGEKEPGTDASPKQESPGAASPGKAPPANSGRPL